MRKEPMPMRSKRVKIGFKGIINSMDEALLDAEYATKAENFAFERGVLTGEIGIDTACTHSLEDGKAYPIPAFEGKSIKNVFVYRNAQNSVNDDRLVVQLGDGTFWWVDIFGGAQSWQKVPSLVMRGDLTAVNYVYNSTPYLVLSSKSEYMYLIGNTTPYVCFDAPHFCSIAVHNERVFGCVNDNGSEVWFSDDFNPINWNVSTNEAGYIKFADECGDAICVVSFLSYLYIFREYGIYRLTAYGDQSEFVLKKLFTDTGRIYKDTIVTCGDKIVFLAEEGLFAFDGYSVSRIAKEVPQVFCKDKACAVYLGGCYYMACCLAEGGEINDSLVKLNMQNGQFCVMSGVSIRMLRCIKSHNLQQVVCVLQGDKGNTLGVISKSGMYFSTPTAKRYVGAYNSMTSSAQKVVRKVSITTKYDVTLVVVVDGKRYEYALLGSDLPQTVVVEKKGFNIGFELQTQAQFAHVAPFVADIDWEVA